MMFGLHLARFVCICVYTYTYSIYPTYKVILHANLRVPRLQDWRAHTNCL